MSNKILTAESLALAAKPKKRRIKPGRLVGAIVSIIIGIIMIYPVFWMLMSSFKGVYEVVNENGETINVIEDISQTALSLPKKWTLDSYTIGWNGGTVGGSETTFGTYFLNSFIVAGVGTIGTVISSAIVAYSFSRGKYRGRKLLFALSLGTMMIPSQILMVPQYLWFKQLGWIGTFNPLIIPPFFAVAGFFVYLMTNFMDGIPRELDEAARIDGCSFYGIFGRVILPLSVPALITGGIFSFMWKWDDFMGPLLYLTDEKKKTVSLALQKLLDQNDGTIVGNPGAQMFAMSVLSLVPIVLIFFFLQKYLVEGIATTGLKG